MGAFLYKNAFGSYKQTKGISILNSKQASNAL